MDFSQPTQMSGTATILSMLYHEHDSEVTRTPISGMIPLWNETVSLDIPARMETSPVHDTICSTLLSASVYEALGKYKRLVGSHTSVIVIRSDCRVSSFCPGDVKRAQGKADSTHPILLVVHIGTPKR